MFTAALKKYVLVAGIRLSACSHLHNLISLCYAFKGMNYTVKLYLCAYRCPHETIESNYRWSRATWNVHFLATSDM